MRSGLLQRAIGLGLLAVIVLGCGPGDELGSKREWSVLQAAEYTNRAGTSRERVMLSTYDEYRAAGILSEDASHRIWVLLNPTYKPLIKELPTKASYYLSSGDFERILHDGNPTKEVAEYLKTRVRSADPAFPADSPARSAE